MSIKQDEAALDSSSRRLDELAALPDDWDSYGAPALSAVAIQAARHLLMRLEESVGWPRAAATTPSHIAPLPSGGVQLEWTGPTKDIEVEISPDGKLAYLLIDRSREERQFSEDEDVPEPTIVDLVAQVAQS